jgi:hypothetical protein
LRGGLLAAQAASRSVAGNAMFDAFYARYATACALLEIVPLSQSDLLALIEALLQRVGATIQ